MMEMVGIWKLIAIVLGASGFWRLVDALVRYRNEQRLKNAEARNLDSEAENNIVSNWVQWSQTLERRVKESEERSATMQKVIETQRKQIRCLQRKVEGLERKNKELLQKVKQKNEHI